VSGCRGSESVLWGQVISPMSSFSSASSALQEPAQRVWVKGSSTKVSGL